MGVVQRRSTSPCHGEDAGSTPVVHSNEMWRNGSAPDLGSGGWGFDSLRLDDGPVAQSGRAPGLQPGNVGSNPTGSTKTLKNPYRDEGTWLNGRASV